MSGLSLCVASLCVFYLVLVAPVLGTWRYQRVMKRIAMKPTLRVRFYLLTIALTWIRLLVVGIIALSSAVPFSTFGLRTPDYELLNEIDAPWFTSWLLTLFLIILLGLLAFVGVILNERVLRNPEKRGRLLQQLMRLKEMLPHTALERRLWLLFSISVGVSEEIIYRGFLPWYFLQVGNVLKLQISSLLAMALSTLIFALAHIYQGRSGVIFAGIIGGACAYFYVATNSLLIPIVFHILIDMRIVLLMPTFLRLMESEYLFSLQNQVPFAEEHNGEEGQASNIGQRQQ